MDKRFNNKSQEQKVEKEKKTKSSRVERGEAKRRMWNVREIKSNQIK